MAISPKSKGLGNIGNIVNRQGLAAPVRPVAKAPVRPVANKATTTLAQRQAAPSPFKNYSKPAQAKVNPLANQPQQSMIPPQLAPMPVVPGQQGNPNQMIPPNSISKGPQVGLQQPFNPFYINPDQSQKIAPPLTGTIGQPTPDVEPPMGGGYNPVAEPGYDFGGNLIMPPPGGGIDWSQFMLPDQSGAGDLRFESPIGINQPGPGQMFSGPMSSGPTSEIVNQGMNMFGADVVPDDIYGQMNQMPGSNAGYIATNQIYDPNAAMKPGNSLATAFNPQGTANSGSLFGGGGFAGK